MTNETLEEVAEIFVKNRFTKKICGDESYPDIYASKEGIVESHILFAKWQQERMYSEEEVKDLIEDWTKMGNGLNQNFPSNKFNIWFEQFKK